jgi:hypothetical protein
MSSSLRSRLAELANTFSASVLAAIRGASLEELLTESSGARLRSPAPAPSRAPAKRPARAVPAKVVPVAAARVAPFPAARRRGGRLARRSSGDIVGVVGTIVSLLAANPGGLRAEQIRTKLGLEAKELPRPLKEGLEAGQFSKSGQKRATTYFVGAGKGAARTAKAARPAAKRAGRSAASKPAKAKKAKKAKSK